MLYLGVNTPSINQRTSLFCRTQLKAVAPHFLGETMIALLIFPLLGLATLIAISLSVGDDHKNRWELNEANPCCGETEIKSIPHAISTTEQFEQVVAA